MKLKVSGLDQIDDPSADFIPRYVVRNMFLDHKYQFFLPGDGDIRTAAQIHVSPTPRHDADTPHLEEVLNAGVFIQIEDTNGNTFDLAECKRNAGFEHAYGILYHNLLSKEIWLLRQTRETRDTVRQGQIEDGTYVPVKLYGLSDTGKDDLPEFLWEESMIEGEFYISTDDAPVLTACAWCSDLNPSEDNRSRMDTDALEEMDAVRAEVRKNVRDHKKNAGMDTPRM